MAKRKIKNPAVWAFPASRSVAGGNQEVGDELNVFPTLPGLGGGSRSGLELDGWTDCRRDVSEIMYDIDIRQEETTTAVNRGFRSEEGVESSCGVQIGFRPDRGLGDGLYAMIRKEAQGVAGDTKAGKIFLAIQHQAAANGNLVADAGNPIFMCLVSVTKVPGGGRVNTLANWRLDYPSSGEFKLVDGGDLAASTTIPARNGPVGYGDNAGGKDISSSTSSNPATPAERLAYVNSQAPVYT